MKTRKISVILLLVIALLISLPGISVSTANADYSISWHTIDGGGGTSSGGQYSLTATIGQHDAGEMAGGDYEMLGGFLPGGPLCYVEFDDFARFTVQWRNTGCSLANNWCQGADLDNLNDVGTDDLKLFIIEWLYQCPYGWPLK